MRTPSHILLLTAWLAGGAPGLLAQTNVVATNTPPRLTSAEFRLSPADRLAYWIEEDPVKGADPDLVTVNALGEASFRVSRGSDLAIALEVKGKTLPETIALLKAKLDEDYYQNAKVRLELRETTARFGQVLFIGRGTRGNVVQLRAGEELRIFEAVFQAGVNEWANLKKVKLTRVDPATQKTEIKLIDLEEIKRGNRANNILLRSGDIIEVPEKMFNFGE